MTSTLDLTVDEDFDDDLDSNGSNETEMENDSNLDGLGLSKFGKLVGGRNIRIVSPIILGIMIPTDSCFSER